MMQIQCTKKLLKELGVVELQAAEEESIFCWHANLLTMNRRKAIVLMNDSSRYSIILYGLKAKHMKKINEIIIEAIRDTWLAEGIRPEIIEAYLSAGKNFAFSATKDRSMVARLNKACDHVYFYSHHIVTDSLGQPTVDKKCNKLIVGNVDKSYSKPNENLYKDLQSFSGDSIFNKEALLLHIQLRLDNHNVWRKVIVPKHIDFPDLHQTIQNAFGWQDYHLHEFNVYPIDVHVEEIFEQKPIINLVCNDDAFDYDYGVPMKLTVNQTVMEYLPCILTYNYDFGDDWRHVITVEKVIENYEQNYAVCVEAKGNTPPENVGGDGGYDEFLAILENPEHPDYVHTKSWGDSQGFASFDLELVNRRLKHI